MDVQLKLETQNSYKDAFYREGFLMIVAKDLQFIEMKVCTKKKTYSWYINQKIIEKRVNERRFSTEMANSLNSYNNFK